MRTGQEHSPFSPTPIDTILRPNVLTTAPVPIHTRTSLVRRPTRSTPPRNICPILFFSLFHFADLLSALSATVKFAYHFLVPQKWSLSGEEADTCCVYWWSPLLTVDCCPNGLIRLEDVLLAIYSHSEVLTHCARNCTSTNLLSLVFRLHYLHAPIDSFSFRDVRIEGKQ